MTALADFTATSIAGNHVDLADYTGTVVLVVNTASKCGFTPQYSGLQELHERFSDQGFTVLGFPCDQFMHQEPGHEREIAEFCSVTYGVQFLMFAKIEVNGAGAHPLYQWLTGSHQGGADGTGDDAAADRQIAAEPIAWNFTKFLLGRDGTVLARYASDVEPADIAG